MMRTSCIVRTAGAVALLCGMLAGGGRPAWAAELPGTEPLSPLAKKLLGASEEQLAKFEEGQQKGLIEIAPVNLPVDPPGDCNHYGWPIGTMVDETIIVMHRRIPGHAGPRTSGWPNEKHSYGIVLRSEDGGRTWSEPYDLRLCMKPLDRYRGGLVPLSHRSKFDPENKSKQGYMIHLHAIGTTRDGAVVAINNHGVFRSEDQGKTWRHFSKALREDTFHHEMVNLGSRIIDYPGQGLLAFGNWYGPPGKPEAERDPRRKLVVLKSSDGGATWTAEDQEVGFAQYEPNAIVHEDAFFMITRNQKTPAMLQLWYRPGEPGKITEPNMVRTRDTSDVVFNPITQRFEVVQSDRAHMSVVLWSIDPEDWFSGQWRNEGTLFHRTGVMGRDADGFHTGGAVLDAGRGVRHIFIYSGHANGPAGVFRITRTLDTDRLAKFLRTTE